MKDKSHLNNSNEAVILSLFARCENCFSWIILLYNAEKEGFWLPNKTYFMAIFCITSHLFMSYFETFWFSFVW